MGEEVKSAQGTDHIGEHTHLWVLWALVSWQDFWVECIPFNINFHLFLLAAQLQRLIHILKMKPTQDSWHLGSGMRAAVKNVLRGGRGAVAGPINWQDEWNS